MKLGTIYYDDDLILHKQYEYIEYKKISDYTEIKDDGLPILVIGWNLIKPMGNLNILDKKINNNIQWTFSFKEKKSDYIGGLVRFPENVFIFYLKKYNKTQIENYNDIFGIITPESKIFINKNKILFLKEANKYYVLNLKEIVFFDGAILSDFITKLKNKTKNIVYDVDGLQENKYYALFYEVNTNIIKYLTPYLFFNN